MSAPTFVGTRQLETFAETVNEQVARFATLPVLQKLHRGELTVGDYQAILLRIFHQVHESASTFALAASMVDTDRFEIKSYLMQHAEEEKLHWQWIVSDLRKTGYQGPDPRSLSPDPSAAGYIGYNYYVALKKPVCRLAIAATLESIGASFGERYAVKLMTVLSLKEDQVLFFKGHGDTDIGHTREIMDVLERANFDASEWKALCTAASTAGTLYSRIYDI
jgi:Iron-containing redox enzyme